MKSILRLVKNNQYEIAEQWGLSELSKILVNAQLGANSEIFKRQYEKSLEIDLFYEGNYSGIYSRSTPAKKGSIAVVTMNGIMMANSGACNKGVDQVAQEFHMLYRDKNISGILFEVTSGGGESIAGDIIYNVIEDRTKPVVAYTYFLGSAAVKGTLPCDEIIAASSSTEIGSIGTLISLSKKFVDKAVEDDMDFYSEHSERKNEGWRELKNGNHQPLIDRATAIDIEFMNKVKKNRKLKGDRKYQKDTLSGALFLSQEAKSRGLIDGIGTKQYAFKRLNSHIKNFKRN